MAVPNIFANATTSIPLSQLDQNFATAITLGNTAVYLGNTTTTIGNVTLTNVTISSGNSTVTKETVTTITSPASTALTIQSNSVTAITVDTSQNVMIGTTSTSGKLRVSAGDGNPILLVNGSSYGVRIGCTAGTGGVIEGVDTTGVSSYQPMVVGGSILVFTISGSEKMRIESSGNLLINETSRWRSVGKLSMTCGSDDGIAVLTSSAGLIVRKTAYTNSFLCLFENNGGSQVGAITTNGSTTTYTTTSDYRLKENVQPMTDALAKVLQLNPVTYKWKESGLDGQGFIAHELQAIVPDCVVGEKDGVDEKGEMKLQGIDTSFLVATLTAAIQEQQAMIETLKAKVAALEAK